jgi:hypothetical protein
VCVCVYVCAYVCLFVYACILCRESQVQCVCVYVGTYVSLFVYASILCRERQVHFSFSSVAAVAALEELCCSSSL